MILNARSMVQDVIQIRNSIIKHVNGNINTIASAKKITVGILPQVFTRIVNISKILSILQWLCVMKLWILYQPKW